MSVPGIPRITSVDEDGFICLVAAGPYDGFVGTDWGLDELLTRFAEQMSRGALFVAYAGPDAAGGELRIVAEGSSQRAEREAAGVIDAADGVWLTDYTQLTMAAQFDDERPEPDDPDSRLSVPAGRYRILLREFASGDDPVFELVVSPAGVDDTVTHAVVPWFE
ncbi:hypothetical protein [Rhodococcus sp. W8901]|uniref:hypothetical protein n=1 Tax=Rhodococcus sp. W8901 TaxID=2742603 RepID=UPI001582FBD0|nr:hypothetical protein [Rhodococcus sp. W8901]QKT12818.1 hypothetical protein HUN07_20745 [Rhodococcus sp. W8901]